MPSSLKLTIALGGNAILQRGDKGTHAVQTANVRKAAESISRLVEAGHDVTLAHGNGPQVGAILLQNQGTDKVPEMPLFVCGAESQGLIGFMMEQELGNVFAKKGIKIPVACIVTQTVVSLDDPAFKNPTKPIGKFYSEKEAMELKAEGKDVREDAGRGWRVVVPSPQPVEIVEAPAIKALVDHKFCVVSTGGGGIPVIRTKEGEVKGVDAVIDKDNSTSLLATQLGSDHLIILTDVSNACINYGKPDQKALGKVSVAEMEKHIADEQFAKGSMLPKVTAAIRFVKATGRDAIITSLDKAYEAVSDPSVGTRITP
ncbi:Carbamate kinase [Aduncisulcus paluster]|uniref:Carbamate kinase n=1 Tax=Aduncisulcus paluster TaxID=2918883 RepID=A0ABQ5K4E6_9EUKA|nr:Carbamate kinase [Aduncisulcus paluster]